LVKTTAKRSLVGNGADAACAPAAAALPSNYMATIGDVTLLDLCRKVELAAARLYHLYAKLHRDEVGISALWLKTAREEENHAQQIQMVIRRRGQLAVTIQADPEKAQKALALIEEMIAQGMVSVPPVHRALEDAVTAEHAFVQFHADYAVEFREESDRSLFRSMMAADKDHVGALQAALDALTPE
jgi:rubrerythrin